jgi:hypothetical protein
MKRDVKRRRQPCSEGSLLRTALPYIVITDDNGLNYVSMSLATAPDLDETYFD